MTEFLKYHQDQSQAQQATLLTHLTKVFVDNANAQPQHPAGDSEYRIVEFEYDADNGITFDAWYLRYETLFTEDAASLTDAAKTRLLLRKLSTRCHSLYINSILPLTPKDNTFANTVLQLKNIFGRQESLFSLRYKCLQVAKSDIEDFNAYAASVNKHCEDSRPVQVSSVCVWATVIPVRGCQNEAPVHHRWPRCGQRQTSEPGYRMPSYSQTQERHRIDRGAQRQWYQPQASCRPPKHTKHTYAGETNNTQAARSTEAEE